MKQKVTNSGAAETHLFDRVEDEFGIDLQLLSHNLDLSYEERLSQHHAAYTLLIELERARHGSTGSQQTS